MGVCKTTAASDRRAPGEPFGWRAESANVEGGKSGGFWRVAVRMGPAAGGDNGGGEGGGEKEGTGAAMGKQTGDAVTGETLVPGSRHGRRCGRGEGGGGRRMQGRMTKRCHSISESLALAKGDSKYIAIRMRT